MRSALGRLYPWLGAALSGLVLAVSMPPHGVPALAWVAFVPLLVVVRRAVDSLGRVLLLGWVAGTSFALVAFDWMPLTLQRFAQATPPSAMVGSVVFSLWTGAMFAGWTGCIAIGPQRGVRALAWAMLSGCGVFHVWPSLFPFTPVAGLAEVPAWIQSASLGGTSSVEALVLSVSTALALAVDGGHRWWRWGGVAAILFCSNALLGHWRLAVLDHEAASWPRIRVGVVQPNFALGSNAAVRKLDVLREMSAQLERAGAQVVVWPEAGAYPFVLPRPLTRDPRGYRRVLARHGLPTLFGVKTRDARSNAEYNSLVLVDARGDVAGTFDKTRLVPMGETAGWLDPRWVQDVMPAASQTEPGRGPVGLPLEYGPDQRAIVGPFICYEDLLADFGRAVASQPGGVNLFVSVANDGWFGGGRGPAGHAALSRIRAVEHRVPMVRAVLAGPSQVVDAGGRVTGGLEAHDPAPGQSLAAELLVDDVAFPPPGTGQPTWYARVGWLFAPLCSLVTSVGLVLLWSRREVSYRGART